MSLSGMLCAEDALRSSDCFVVLGDNHRFKNSTYADQFFRQARLRAIETDCPVIVLMSAGPSGYVDANGTLTRSLSGFNSKALRDKVGQVYLNCPC